MYNINNTEKVEDYNNNTNKDLQMAFYTIQQIIHQRDEKIRQLEEENLQLKLKLREYESSKYSREFSNKENLRIQINENEHNSHTHNNFSNTNRDINMNNTLNRQRNNTANNYTNNANAIKYQNEREDFALSPGSPVTNLKTQNDLQISNNARNNFVPVYSNENVDSNYLYTPNQNFGIMSPPRLNTIVDESNQSRNEVKIFLNEVREKIPAKDFKEFIKLIKILTDKNNQVPVNRKEIFDKVKILFGVQFRDMYYKFEQLLSLKK